MTSNIVQARVPSELVKQLDRLVKAGYYKNRSEAIVDALRHFVGTQETSSEVARAIRLQMQGHQHPFEEAQQEELRTIAKKLVWNSELRARFGTSLDETMKTLRGRV